MIRYDYGLKPNIMIAGGTGALSAQNTVAASEYRSIPCKERRKCFKTNAEIEIRWKSPPEDKSFPETICRIDFFRSYEQKGEFL